MITSNENDFIWTDDVEGEVRKLFGDTTEELYTDGALVLKATIPDEIWKDVVMLKEKVDEIRRHPYHWLLRHTNSGRNKYQFTVPSSQFHETFLYAYILYLGQYYLLRRHDILIKHSMRKVKFRNNSDHFDGYDLWVNYTTKGDWNDKHTHGGKLSGVIYYENTEKIATEFQGGLSIYGKPKEIVMFPAQLTHWVAKQEEDYERVAMAYNLEVLL